MHVDTAGAVAWPVLVDPVLETFGAAPGSTYGVSSNCANSGAYGYLCYANAAGYWYFYTTNRYQLFGIAASNGLELYGGTSFTNASQEYFALPAPPNVYIYAMDQYNQSFTESPAASYPAYIYNEGTISYGSGANAGFSQPGAAGYSTNGGQTYTTASSTSAGYSNLYPMSNVDWAYCAYAAGGTPCGANQPNLATGNEAAWAMDAYVPTPNSQALGLQTSAPVAFVGSTAILESQTLDPTIAVQHSSPPSSSTWVRSYSDQATLTGTDAGLGMGSVSLSGPGVPNGTITDTSSGTGTFGNILPSYMPAAISYTAPEGVDTYIASATDVAGNTATPSTWTVKVDNTPPVFGALSGSLAPPASGSPPPTTLPVGQLTVPVTDAVSGVASITASIDCPGATNLQGAASQNPTTGEPLTATFTLNALTCSRGTHTITLTATDAAGNLATKTVVLDLEPQAGSEGYYDYLSQQLDDQMNLSENVGTGALGLTASDISIAGTAGMDLDVTRTYSSFGYPEMKSQAQQDSQDLSPGWSLSIGPDVHLTTFGSGSMQYVRYYDPTGATWEFTPASGGGFNQAPGLPATLVQNTNGTYTLTYYLTNTVYTFAAPASGSTTAPLTSETDRNGNTITVNYVAGTCGTSVGCEVSTIQGTQNQVLTFTYNGSGQITQIEDSSGRLWKYGYNSSGQLDLYTDPTGAQTAYSYAPTTSLLAGVTDPNLNTSTISYDPDGSNRVASVTEPDGTPSAPMNQVTKFNYKSTTLNPVTGIAGETDVTDPDTNVTEYYLDTAGRVIQIQDPTGISVGQTWNSNGTSATSGDTFTGATATVGYKTGSTSNQYLPNSITEASGAADGLTYNNAAQPYLPAAVTDPEGHTLNMTYNAKGNLATVSGADSGTTQTPVNLTYNANGTVATSTDGDQNVTTYTYNPLGQLTTVTPPAPLGTTTLTYDSEGRVQTGTDGNGNTTTYAYDGDDRVKTQTVTGPNGTSSFSYTYDGNGNELTMTASNDGTTTYTYDDANRQITDAEPGSATTMYGYDGDDDLTSVIDGLYDNDTFNYDGAGRLKKVVFNGQTGQTYSYNYNYGPAQGTNLSQPLNSETITYPNGIVATWTYTHGQVADMNYSGTAGTLQDFKYNYNTTGSPSTPTDLIQQETDQPVGNLSSYTYDTFDRLTGATVTNGGNQVHNYQYAYDGADNRTSETVDGTETGYVYNAANELETATTGGEARSFGYDADGNQTSDSTGYSETYNALNQTTSFTDGLQILNDLSPTYNGPGQSDRLSTSSAVTYSTTTLGVTSSDDTTLLGIVGPPDNTPNGQTTYVRDPYGNLLGITTVHSGLLGLTNANYTYATDLLGSVRAIYDSSQTLQTAYTYDPYGNIVTNSPDNVTQPYRFQGQYQDSTGLYHTGERYYDPTTGRWTQPDPDAQSLVTDPTQTNPYSFAGGDPVNNVDIDGESAKSKLERALCTILLCGNLGAFVADVVEAIGGNAGAAIVEKAIVDVESGFKDLKEELEEAAEEVKEAAKGGAKDHGPEESGISRILKLVFPIGICPC
jgi:RHS repeat-associated protein